MIDQVPQHQQGLGCLEHLPPGGSIVDRVLGERVDEVGKVHTSTVLVHTFDSRDSGNESHRRAACFITSHFSEQKSQCSAQWMESDAQWTESDAQWMKSDAQ
ncbi:hypothetical protein GCM10009624_02370 [Gordonia sinesedis]